jgi:hypothetical protein
VDPNFPTKLELEGSMFVIIGSPADAVGFLVYTVDNYISRNSSETS